MLPELNFKKHFGIDANFYFNKQLDEFFEKNKDTNETVGKINLHMMRQNRTVIDEVNVRKRKLGLLYSLAIKEEDSESLGSIRTVYASIKKQRDLLRGLDGYLRRVNLNVEWMQAIDKYMHQSILERLQRMDKLIIPTLLEVSTVNIYLYWLEQQGISWDEDIYSHMDDEDDTYIKYIEETIEECKQTLPQEILDNLNQIRMNYIEQRKRKLELIKAEKESEKVMKRLQFAEDAMVMLQNWATTQIQNEQMIPNSIRIGSVYRTAYARLDKMRPLIEDGTYKFRLIAAVKYNQCNKISVSAFKWVKLNENGDVEMSFGLSNAEPFFYELDQSLYDKVVNELNEDYIIATVDLDIFERREQRTVEEGFIEEGFSYDFRLETGNHNFDAAHFNIDTEVVYSARSGTDEYTAVPVEQRREFLLWRIHQAKCALGCGKAILMAYEMFDENGAIKHEDEMKDIKNEIFHVFESEEYLLHLFSKQPNITNEYTEKENTKSERQKLSRAVNSIESCLVEVLGFPIADMNHLWIEAIINTIDLNNLCDKSLRALYDACEYCRRKFSDITSFSCAYRGIGGAVHTEHIIACEASRTNKKYMCNRCNDCGCWISVEKKRHISHLEMSKRYACANGIFLTEELILSYLSQEVETESVQ